MSYDNIEQKLVGKKVNRVFMNEDYIKFETDQGNIVYKVSGECCSASIFYDFYGVKKLLENGPVTEVKEVDLYPTDIVKSPEKYGSEKDKKGEDSSISVYGYQITTKDPILGPVTSVFSFRNYSNGYYGGSLENADENIEVLPELTEDILETVENPIKKNL